MDRRAALKGGLALTAIMSAGGTTHASRDEFQVPAEEDPHELTFMQWPVSRIVHPDQDFLSLLQETIARIANTIAEFEPVVLLAASGDPAGVRRLVSSQVELWDIPTEDLWCRDSGPSSYGPKMGGGLFAILSSMAGVGGKYIIATEKSPSVRPSAWDCRFSAPGYEARLAGSSRMDTDC